MKPSKINRIYFIWLRGQYQLCKPYVCWLWEKLKVCLATTYLFSVYIHTQHSWTSLNSDERLREEKNNFFSLQINGKEEKNGEKIMNYTVALEHRIRINMCYLHWSQLIRDVQTKWNEVFSTSTWRCHFLVWCSFYSIFAHTLCVCVPVDQPKHYKSQVHGKVV